MPSPLFYPAESSVIPCEKWVVLADATAGPMTLTMCPVAGSLVGHVYHLVDWKRVAATHPITIRPHGTEKVNGADSYQLTLNGQSVGLVASTAGWEVVLFSWPTAVSGPTGPTGPQGQPGAQGQPGVAGTPGTPGTSANVRAGAVAVPLLTLTVDVSFSTPMPSANYRVVWSQTVTSVAVTVSNKTANGFRFNIAVSTALSINWIAALDM